MDKKTEGRTAYQIMEDAAAQICDRVCKYNELYGEDEDKEETLYAMCEKCPLNRLI